MGFVVRPAGALIFGHIGDSIGRTRALTVSIVIIAVATVLIGALPGYHVPGSYSIGVGAPVLLALLRVVQVRGRLRMGAPASRRERCPCSCQCAVASFQIRQESVELESGPTRAAAGPGAGRRVLRGRDLHFGAGACQAARHLGGVHDVGSPGWQPLPCCASCGCWPCSAHLPQGARQPA